MNKAKHVIGEYKQVVSFTPLLTMVLGMHSSIMSDTEPSEVQMKCFRWNSLTLKIMKGMQALDAAESFFATHALLRFPLRTSVVQVEVLLGWARLASLC